jgi:hypothetical protein
VPGRRMRQVGRSGRRASSGTNDGGKITGAGEDVEIDGSQWNLL